MTTINIEVIEQGNSSKEPIPDDQWLIPSNIEKTFLIQKATIIDMKDGRYPQVQLIAVDPETGKYVSIGTTFRLLKGVVTVAAGVAERNGLHDF